MAIVRVAIPLLKGKGRIHLEKGRPWSIFEHAVLIALSRQSYSVSALSEYANLPKRLVLECIIRLMRAGWVELSQTRNGITFNITSKGISVVSYDELPSSSKLYTRWVSFIIDRVCGGLYRSREFQFYEKHVLEKRNKKERFVWMQPRNTCMFENFSDVAFTLLEDDETFKSIEPEGARLVDRYALITVRNNEVEGLPQRAPIELKELVLEASREASKNVVGSFSSVFVPRPTPPYIEGPLPLTVRSVFELDDLVLGGQAHQQAFFDILRTAKHRIVIHSTFIAQDKFKIVYPILLSAAKRCVLIDILWGEDEEKKSTRSTKMTVSHFRELISKEGLDVSFRIHPFSTRSHAKIVVADKGSPDSYVALVGSCNWLSSGFHSFEASVRLRDPRLIADILKQLVELSLGFDGHWTELTNELTRMSIEVSKKEIPRGHESDLSVVLGPQHAIYVREARDSSTSRMFVTSHRMSMATRPAVIVPAIAATRNRNVDVSVYYCQSNLSNTQSSDLTLLADQEGIKLRPVQCPSLHAKILAWDNDHVLITSQNWLSADPSESNLRREIGIYIKEDGVARKVIENFEAVRLC